MFFIGLQIPAHLLPTIASAGDSDGDDDYTLALPSDLTASHAAGPSLPSKSESNTYTPPLKRHYPQPLPTAYTSQIEGTSGVQEFLEREERRRKLEKEANKLKKLQREEWMLVLPKSGDLLACLVSSHVALHFPLDRDASGKTATSCYEVAGRKRRAANTPEDSRATAKRRRRVEDISEELRGTKVTSRTEKEGKKHKQSVNPPFPGNDISLGGRPMDDQRRQKMLRDAKGLPERFGSGCSGNFIRWNLIESLSRTVASPLALAMKTSAISSGTIVASKSSTRVSEQCAVGFQARVREAEPRCMMLPSFGHLKLLPHCRLCRVVGLFM
ncbi:uncharacterized protein F5147DRAFT_763752 [Suillus discolor]|uniref:DUF3752 domain-containing protein n=1 Tax=Suillus discolor TaxID=1912936 RepID=A0A9P7EYJ0_9AGAM|nr:uncharacterized protein F5147DRAFT_763752 [Suillus discolor]KAG2095479.1 hypothetical protein F5147DRAFT_763752 [Suillus discolor]